MAVHHLDRAQAGRIAVRAQLLDAPRPTDLLPILRHDRLVGKLDATADRKAGALRVDAIHEDIPFTTAIHAAVQDEIDALASWLGLTVTGPAARNRRR
jgi:uncharacterized protein YcaQ